MSSRPQSWSRIGLESLIKLRIAVLNGATEKDLIVSLESGKNNRNEKIEEKEKKSSKLSKIFDLITAPVPVLNYGKICGTYVAIKNYL